MRGKVMIAPRRAASKGSLSKRSLPGLCALGLAALLPASPAWAGKNDDAWAKCIWEQVPTSAFNWLKMPAPKNHYGLAEVPPEYALQFRLQAACFASMTAPGKERPPSFNAKAVRKALEARRPAGASADKVDPRAYRCRRYFLTDKEMKNPAGFDWGFGEDTGKPQFFSMTFMFAAKGGGAVGLPRQGGLRKCSYIQADGTFADA